MQKITTFLEIDTVLKSKGWYLDYYCNKNVFQATYL